MKVRIEITVGDKFIADTYSEDDEVFKCRRFPSEEIKKIQQHLMWLMSEAVERAITDQLNQVSEPMRAPVPSPRG